MNIIHKKKWITLNLNFTNSRMVPKALGVYVILEVQKWVQNIPLGIKIIYIGKGNLRRRFQDHTSILREHNPKLANNIIKKNLEFWFIETASNIMDDVETRLIEEVSIVDPNLTNVLKKKINKIGENSYVG